MHCTNTSISFSALVDRLAEYFAGAREEDVFVWLDIFAINQKEGRAMAELDDGRTLAETIETSSGCLVVLDAALLPVQRLWCLYEIGSCPEDKLELLAPAGMPDAAIAQARGRIDAESANCFSPADKEMIERHIQAQMGSLRELTERLQLRFTLTPLGYTADIHALNERRRNAPLKELDKYTRFAGAMPGLAAVICGGAGEGKSTIAAALSESCDASHFCKRSDVRRQDAARIAHSLAYQLALTRPAARRHILELSDGDLERARTDERVASDVLLAGALNALPGDEHAVLLIDALDEGANRLTNTAFNLLERLAKVAPERWSLLVTMRPESMGRLGRLFSAGNRIEVHPRDLRDVSGAEVDSDATTAGKGSSETVLLQLLRGALAGSGLGGAACESVDDAYRAFFDAASRNREEATLISVVTAAREPLSESHLEMLGLLGALHNLPGKGLLFERREYRVQMLHGSLGEWIRATGGAAATLVGHAALAANAAAQLADTYDASSPIDRYALEHGHEHLAEALRLAKEGGGAVEGSADAAKACALWRELLVARRPEHRAGEPRGVQVEWVATPACCTWLRNQAAAGRAKPLVSELLRLEEALRGSTVPAAAGLMALVRCVRAGWGRHVAPLHDDAVGGGSVRMAFSRFALNAPADSPLFDEAVVHGLCNTGQLTSRRLPPERGITALLFSIQTDMGEVSASAYSPDGRCVATGGADGSVRVLDAETGEQVIAMKNDDGAAHVRSVEWSPDGSRLASGGEDRTARIWDFETGTQLHVLSSSKGDVNEVRWSADGRMLAGACDSFARVWDADRGEEVCAFQVTTAAGSAEQINCVAWSPDGSQLATGSYDDMVRVWDAATGEQVHLLQGHEGNVTGVDWSACGRMLASCAEDQTVRVWDAQTGDAAGVLVGHAAPVSAVRWSPDSRRLASAGGDQIVRLWDVDEGKQIRAMKGGHTQWIDGVAWSPEGKRVTTAGRDGVVGIWDVTIDLTDASEETHAPEGHTASVRSVAWSPDGTALLSAGSDFHADDETLRVWDAVKGHCLRVLKGHEKGGYAGLMACTWSPDGTRLASASFDYSLRVWDACTGDCLHTFTTEEGLGMYSSSWSPDSHYIASGREDNTIHVWDARTGAHRLLSDGERGSCKECHTSDVVDAAWSPDGRLLATCSSDKTLRVWDVATSEHVRVLRAPGAPQPLYMAAWSPNGRWIAVAGGGDTIHVWNAEVTGADDGDEPVFKLKGSLGGGATHVAWSPDSARLAAAHQDTAVCVWHMETQALERTLYGHTAELCGVAWSPDGRSIVSGSADKSLRVWSELGLQ